MGPDIVRDRTRPDIVPSDGEPDIVGNVAQPQPEASAFLTQCIMYFLLELLKINYMLYREINLYN